MRAKGTVAIPLIFGAAFAGAAALLGASAFWVLAAFWAGATIGSLLFPPGMKMNQMKMKPASLADFQITQANENQPVPLIYGTAKVPGNIIYYGNLQVEEVTEEVEGGKGGGGDEEEVVVGYNYYLDIWQVIGIGKLQLIKTYINDTERAIQASQIIYNDGTQDITPGFGLEFETPLKGIAWIACKRMFTGGTNVTFVPTVHFVVRRILPDIIPYANMYGINGKDYGNNPAAIIYDILTEHCDIPVYMIDIESFKVCAQVFYERRWGLNLVISSQQEAKEVISYILNFVDATLLIDEQTGKIKMKILDDNESYKYTIETKDFIEFTLTKPFWGELPNDFRGAIVDASKDYTVRIPIAVRNSANIYQCKEVKQVAVDLTAFQDKDVAISRMYQIMKRQSFPYAQVSVKVTRKFQNVSVGDVVRIINTDYGIDGVFRVVKKVDSEIDKNEISFDLIQLRSFDSIYVVPQAPTVPVRVEEIKPLTQIRVYEVPYNSVSKYTPAFFILASKETGFELSFAVYISSNGTDYSYLTTIYSYAIVGTLKEDYLADTYEIDDERGILFTPYFDFMRFVNISRQDLFYFKRLALIGEELLAFQYYIPEGVTDYRLKGVIRGVGYTKPQNHYKGEKIYIFNPAMVLVEINRSSAFYLKLVPIGLTKSGNIADAVAIKVEPQLKAMKPYRVARIMAVRSGENVNVDVFPVVKEYLGAGTLAPESYKDEYPFKFEGDILYSLDGNNWVNNGNNANIKITKAEAFTLYVKHRHWGFDSEVAILTVGASDGIYIANFS